MLISLYLYDIVGIGLRNTEVWSTEKKLCVLRRFAAALVFTLILGNCYHTYENSPLFLKNQDNKKRIVSWPTPPILLPLKEYLNFCSNRFDRLSIRSPFLDLPSCYFRWNENRLLSDHCLGYIGYIGILERHRQSSYCYEIRRLLCLLVTFFSAEASRMDNISFLTFTSAQVELTRFKLCAGGRPYVQFTRATYSPPLAAAWRCAGHALLHIFLAEKLSQKRQTPDIPFPIKTLT